MRSTTSCTLALFILASATVAATPARAGSVLWYNGDYDNRDALQNATNIIANTPPTLYQSLVYDNFVVPVGQTWTVNSVFSNDQIVFRSGAAVTSATWEIRSGVSEGNAGTLVAGGDTAATQTAVAPVPGNYYAGPESRISASVPSVVLTAGVYWLAVAPDNTGDFLFYNDRAYIETTSGANSVGVPRGNDGNSFITNTLPGSNPGALNFAATSTVEASTGLTGPFDYSMGVAGVAVSVPEPSSLAQSLVVGMAALAAFGRGLRRRGAGASAAA